VGGLLGLMLIVLNTNNSSSITLPMCLALLIAGIVCTSRMIVSNHTQKDIYIGLIIGIICQLVGAALII
jgi:membrane-associated phospholipid phosphatase